MNLNEFWESRSDLRDECPFPTDHTRLTPNGWTLGTAPADTVVLIQANGVRSIKVACRRCAYVSGAIPLSFAFEHLNPLGTATVVDNLGTTICTHQGCERTDVEWHHFAPRNTFPDADDWPVLPLCRDHHAEWHQRMDGYRWKSRTVA